MINVWELSVGNYVEQGVIQTVGLEDGVRGCFILKNDFDSSMGVFHKMEDITPLEITRDILYKFGFTQENFCSKNEYALIIEDGGYSKSYLVVDIEAKDYYMYSFNMQGTVDVVDDIFDNKFQVHRLQKHYELATNKQLKYSYVKQ